MSAAEPAHPGPDSGTSTGPATVILFRQGPSKRRRRREDTVPNQREPREPSASPQQRLADTIESLFLKHGRTLTDDDTAEAFLIALKAVQFMHDGALAQGVVGEEAHRELRAMTEGMQAVPRIV
ncbi:hypothetical protein [Streptomyces sp. NBC_01483]|uniref:hypothetical protein n=1 Tax=Streptomyces sp. NBC_01483 TaxID=2903883 RepID=UPI002E35C90C|nr:hypothetical protein [Streptomyces sp. NBC_01483]